MYTTHTPSRPFGPKPLRSLLILRALGGFFGVYGIYQSVRWLALSDAMVLTFLAPIFTSYACSLFIPGEKFGLRQQLAAIISLCGVVFIAQPTFLFPRLDAPASDPDNVTPHQRMIAVCFGLLGALGATTAYSVIRVIGPRAHPLISVNYFSSACALISGAAFILVPGLEFRLPADWEEWSMLAFLGVCGFTMQFLLTAGLGYRPEAEMEKREEAWRKKVLRERGVPDEIIEPVIQVIPPVSRAPTDLESAASTSSQTPPVAPKPSSASSSGNRATSMIYTQLLFALIFDKIFWNQLPNAWSWLGSLLILGSAIWSAMGGGEKGGKGGKGKEKSDDGEGSEDDLGEHTPLLEEERRLGE